jgi:hypothetical protein
MQADYQPAEIGLIQTTTLNQERKKACHADANVVPITLFA